MNFIFILPIKMAGAVTESNLINLAAVEKTKRKNIIEPQYCYSTGMNRREIQNQRTNGPVNAHLTISQV